MDLASTSASDSVRLHQRGGGDEASELVAGEEGLLQLRVAADSGVVGVRHDGSANVFGPAALGEDGIALVGMLFGAGIFLVIEVVDEADDAPEFLVFSEFAGVGAQARFHRNGVFAKTF